MRIALKNLTIAVTLCALPAASAWAQHDDRYHSSHWVYDTHHHLNHYYPARGQVVSALPAGAVAVTHSGGPLYFHGGVWFRPSGARFVIVAPPLGVVVPVLPPAYATLWIGAVPYYYANDVYYVEANGGYAVTAGPPGVNVTAPPPPAPLPDPVIYPRAGQSPQQTETDRAGCDQWASQQAAGKDPSVYERAMSACLDAHGYTVR